VTPVKPADVRIYCDADVLGLARLVCRERADCTYPGDVGGRIKKRMRPPCPITSPDTKDRDWIPQAAARGWLIITRDRAIQTKLAEINAVREHGAKMVNLASPDADRTWTQLEVFMTRWREIEALIDQPGPFIYIASRTGKLRAVDLTI
jgi:PIN like domain